MRALCHHQRLLDLHHGLGAGRHAGGDQGRPQHHGPEVHPGQVRDCGLRLNGQPGICDISLNLIDNVSINNIFHCGNCGILEIILICVSLKHSSVTCQDMKKRRSSSSSWFLFFFYPVVWVVLWVMLGVIADESMTAECWKSVWYLFEFVTPQTVVWILFLWIVVYDQLFV